MNIASIDIHELEIPFRFRYGHASAKHTGVRTVVCVARDSEGNCGFGEAVPRTYVTGETPESILEAATDLVNYLLHRVSSFEEYQSRLDRVEDELYRDGAVPCCAICCVDLAVTDLVARQEDKPLVKMLSVADEPKKELIYTASIGISSKMKLTALLLLYKAMGIRHFKVKVGDESDLERMATIRRVLGSDVTVFADANCAWDMDTSRERIEAFSKFDVWALEEPLKIPETEGSCREDGLTDEHFENCARIQADSPIPLIADESLISLRGAKKIIESKAFQIFNIRLSKCGGYRRGGQFAQLAREAGLSFSFGAMVGESPILATAGAIFGASEPGHLYIQGHSHALLHGKAFVEGCPPLRRGGRYNPRLNEVASGLTIDREMLQSLTVNRTTITV